MMNLILLTIIKLLVSSALLVLFYFVLFRGKASHMASRAFLLAIPGLSLVFSLVSFDGNGRFVSFSSLVGSERAVVETPYEVVENRPMSDATAL